MTSTVPTPASTAREDAVTTWTLDPAHSLVEFAVKHMMFTTVKGRFSTAAATLTLDPRDPGNSSVEAEIDAASIDTRQGQRDAHLRSADFFDVERWPTLAFRSRRVERAGDELRLIGDLTIRDVTREVAFRVTDEGRGVNPDGMQVAGFAATTTIDRRDFGLTWNQALETGGVLVANEVRIELSLQFVRD